MCHKDKIYLLQSQRKLTKNVKENLEIHLEKKQETEKRINFIFDATNEIFKSKNSPMESTFELFPDYSDIHLLRNNGIHKISFGSQISRGEMVIKCKEKKFSKNFHMKNSDVCIDIKC